MRILETGEVGIGISTPASLLDIRTSGSTDPFRLYVPNNEDNHIKMFRNNVEYGRFSVYQPTTNFTIQSMRGNLRFTGGNGGSLVQAMEIVGGSGSDAGNVGIGDFREFTPASQLHIHRHPSTTNADFQITSNAAGELTTDGLKLEVAHTTPIAYIKQQEDQPLILSTGSSGGTVTERMRIHSGTNAGFVGINTTIAGAQLEILHNNNSTTSSNIGLNLRTDVSNTNSSQYSFGAVITADDGAYTTGVTSVVDNMVNTGSPTLAMTGIYTRVRNSQSNNIAVARGLDILNDVDFATTKYGIDLNVYDPATTMYGINSNVTGSTTTTIYGLNSNVTGSSSTNIYGVKADANGSSSTTTAYGGHFTGGSATINYGIWASVGSGNYAGYFTGNVYATGTITQLSDSTLKKDIQPITNARSILSQLDPKTYIFKTDDYSYMGLATGTHAGLLAQQVEAVLPSLVTEVYRPAQLDTAGVEISPEANFKSINYNELIPYLIASNNELSNQVDSLINALNASSILNLSNPEIERIGQQVELKDITSIVLKQNDPNPFSESTTISYFIPETVKDAKIMFSDNKGTVLRTAKIETKGDGVLEVYASELSSGIYTYTLICDGKVIESKKMMKTN